MNCASFADAKAMLAAAAAFVAAQESEHGLYNTVSGDCLIQTGPNNCGELHSLADLLKNVAAPELALVEKAVAQIEAGEKVDLHERRYAQTGPEELADALVGPL